MLGYSGIILLYPYADTTLSIADRDVAEAHGIYLFDAPWETLPILNSGLNHGIQRRKLVDVKVIHGPYIGSDHKICTADAAAYALYVLGYLDQAQELLGIFPWKDEFIRENFQLSNKDETRER